MAMQTLPHITATIAELIGTDVLYNETAKSKLDQTATTRANRNPMENPRYNL